MANTKNYKTDEGDRWVIGGTLEILDGAEVIGLKDCSGGSFPTAASQPHTTATAVKELAADLNSLIDKLKSAGIME